MTAQSDNGPHISRRQFFKVSGAIILVVGLEAADASQPRTSASGPFLLTDTIPPADGYLLVDVEKCQGCASCMLACSLVHEGVESLSLSRIQIMQNSFEAFPHDVDMAQCRQCVDPLCVRECPTGALSADPANGNLRIVDQDLCIGCFYCHRACPFTPSRAFLSRDEGEFIARKCDLCANAPYHWAEGGVDGMQACIAICPVGAIAFTPEIPEQDGDGGYQVNLRGDSWGALGYPTE